MSNLAPTLMIQGCTSDAGKSTVVAGLCRLFSQKGLSVAPFKPQNMALNSAVTEEGGEIGRAQALQAYAAGLRASIHMNPVLLKPNSDTGAQVILQGRSIGNLDAQNYHQLKPQIKKAVLDSYHQLSQQYQTILVEGAGSPAEVNLRAGDIANMGFAEAVDCPVILVADIDKGGVFAHIIGTLACLSESEQARIKGFIINRFRGDLALLQDGLDWLEQKTEKPVLGVLPYLHGLHLDAEDAIQRTRQNASSTKLKVIAPLFPHISNHTDLDPLIQHPQVDFQWIKHNQSIPPADLIILPGSKNIHFDLNWLKQQNWPINIHKHLRYGGKLIGICGGLQMLGRHIEDPHQVESKHKTLTGLGILNISTTLQAQKTLRQTQGTLLLPSSSNIPVKGYEIHHGITNYPPTRQPAVLLNDCQVDGMISEDNQILATYLHGLFDTPQALQALLNWTGMENTKPFSLDDHRNCQLDRLAQTLEEHCKIEAIQDIMGL